MNNLNSGPSLDQPVRAKKSPVRRSVFEIGTYNHNFLRRSKNGKTEYPFDLAPAGQ
jgi:hypothetical protein